MRFGTVLFDCDSTLAALEGVDELAGEHRDAIARLTDRAMRGEIPLESVYGERLALARPTRSAIEALGERYIAALVPDAREVVAALTAEGIAVRIITGGLLPAVRPLARMLGLPDEHLAAVGVRFGPEGDYADYDAGSPLARSGGKRAIVEGWLPSLPRPIMMVGDGVTDLEVKPLVDRFVAFAGIVARPAVIDAADVVIHARSLAPVLALALDGEPPRDPRTRPLLERGRSLLGARPAASPSSAPR